MRQNAVSRQDHDRLREILASGINPSSINSYTDRHMDEVGWEQSLFTVALLQKDRESFLLLVEAQGRFGWKADIMEHSCGDQGDLRTMFVALVELDNGYVLQELVATGFDGPYLAAQEKAKNAVQVFIADAAFRDGRIIEELLAMPSWRPVFLEIKPSSYEDNLVEYLFRRMSSRANMND